MNTLKEFMSWRSGERVDITISELEWGFQNILEKYWLKDANWFSYSAYWGPSINKSPILRNESKALKSFRDWILEFSRKIWLELNDEVIGKIYAIRYILLHRSLKILAISAWLSIPVLWYQLSRIEQQQELDRILSESRAACARIIENSCKTNYDGRDIFIQLAPLVAGDSIKDGTEMRTNFYERGNEWICYQLPNTYTVFDQVRWSKWSIQYKPIWFQTAFPSSIRWNANYKKCTTN